MRKTIKKINTPAKQSQGKIPKLNGGKVKQGFVLVVADSWGDEYLAKVKGIVKVYASKKVAQNARVKRFDKEHSVKVSPASEHLTTMYSSDENKIKEILAWKHGEDLQGNDVYETPAAARLALIERMKDSLFDVKYDLQMARYELRQLKTDIARLIKEEAQAKKKLATAKSIKV